MKIQITIVLSIIGLIAAGYAWEKGLQAEVHDGITMSLSGQIFTDNVDVNLELVESKLKMYRLLKERRSLTPDEEAEEEWLKERKAILLAEQRKRRA